MCFSDVFLNNAFFRRALQFMPCRGCRPTYQKFGPMYGSDNAISTVSDFVFVEELLKACSDQDRVSAIGSANSTSPKPSQHVPEVVIKAVDCSIAKNNVTGFQAKDKDACLD